jgi:hypothetical protein
MVWTPVIMGLLLIPLGALAELNANASMSGQLLMTYDLFPTHLE